MWAARAVRIRIVEDGYFVPRSESAAFDLVYGPDRRLLSESTTTRGVRPGGEFAIAGSALNILPSGLANSCQRADHLLFLGPFDANAYGHWITEGVARFWALDGLDDSFRIPVRHLLGFARFLMGRFNGWRTALKAFGVAPNRVVRALPIRATQIVVPDCTARLNAIVLPAHVEATRRIARFLLNGRELRHSDRPCYLSRTRLRRTHRAFFREREVEQHCRSRGFLVVYPERMSLRDQARLFNEHHVFVGPPGSAFHTTLFRFVSSSAHHVYLTSGSGVKPSSTQGLIDSAVGNTADSIACATRIQGTIDRVLDPRRAIEGIERVLA